MHFSACLFASMLSAVGKYGAEMNCHTYIIYVCNCVIVPAYVCTVCVWEECIRPVLLELKLSLELCFAADNTFSVCTYSTASQTWYYLSTYLVST